MSATLSQNMLLAVPLAPLVGAIAAGLFGKQIGRSGAHWITCIGVAISLVISIQTLLAVLDGARFNATIATATPAMVSQCDIERGIFAPKRPTTMAAASGASGTSR